jgi:hypothetical protein
MVRRVSQSRRWYDAVADVWRSWCRPDRWRTRRPGGWVLRFESLETRLAPTCSPAFIDNGVLILNGDDSGNQIETYIEGSGEFREQIFRYWNGSGYSTTGDFVFRFSSIQINPGAGNNNVTIDTAARPLLVNSGGGLDDVYVGQNGLVFTAPITVQNPPATGYTYLHVQDQNNPSATTATLTDTGLTLQWGGQTQQINFVRQQDLRGLDVSLGSAGNIVNVVNTPQSGFGSGGMQTFLEPGAGPNAVSIRGTTGQFVLRSTHVGEHVLIGNNNSVQGIHGGIRVENAPDYTWLDVLDQADPTPRTVEVFTGGPGNAYGVINGLAPAQIQFKYSDISLMQLWTGLGGATVSVDATAVPTVVVGNGPLAVNVGLSGSLAEIRGDLSISNRNGLTLVDVDDRNRAGARAPTLDTYPSGGADFARLQGLAPATIYAQAANTGLLTVRTGTGPVTAAVWTTPVPTNVAGYGPLTVNVGNGSAQPLQGIQAALSISDPGGQTLVVNVNDQNDPADHTNIILDTVNQGADFIRLQNLAPAPIYSVSDQTSTFVVNGGSGTNIWSVEGTAAGVNTAIYGGAGYNQYGAGDANASALFGPLALHGRPGYFNLMEYWDYVSPTPHTYTLTANTISRPGLAPVTFDGMGEVIFVPANVGGNMINVQSVAAAVLTAFDSANDDTTINIGANHSLASVVGPVVVYGAANVVIDDSADTSPPAGPITFSNDIDYGFTIGGLVPASIYLNATQNATINTSLLLGAGNKTLNLQAPPQGVALTLDAGSGTNTLDYTGYAGNVLVDLPLGTATGFSGISNITNVTGASGGGAGFYNVLIGNGGNVLTGGTGRRNLLVAGGSTSTLIGGNQDDLVIGGTTAYDTEAGLASWQAIAAYWAGADDYLTRVANLTSGSGVPLLDAMTVFGNGGGNTMIGSGELALIYSDGLDTILGFDPGSIVYPIAP